MKKVAFTSIGDCCVDVYPDHHKVFLGGTAFNTAVQATRAGAKASIISAIGTDDYGKKFLSEAKTYGINTSNLAVRKGSTSSVQIPLDEKGRPVFAGWDLGVLKEFRLSQEDAAFLQTQDIVKITYLKPLQKMFESFCHSEPFDVAQGKLSRGISPHEILRNDSISFSPPLQKIPPFRYRSSRDDKKPLLVCDFAGGSQYSVRFEEIEKYIDLFDICIRSVDVSDKKELSFLEQVARQYNKIIIASLGAHGSIVFAQKQTYTYPAIETKVTDTTGAGDAYIANFALVYFQTHDIPKAMEEATKKASATITHFGANY